MTETRSSESAAPLGPIIIGLGGVVVLAGLCFWQVQRLNWKQDVIGRMEMRASGPAQALPGAPDPERDDYTPVSVVGVFDHADERYFLTSIKPGGPGFNIITPLETEAGRRILVDRGYVPEARRDPATRAASQLEGAVTVAGVLRWPNEVGPFTPDPVESRREWYARDVPALAAALSTEPLMIQQAPTGDRTGPRGTAPEVSLPNNHLQYALTWAGLGLIWAAMSLIWFRKERRLARGANDG